MIATDCALYATSTCDDAYAYAFLHLFLPVVIVHGVLFVVWLASSTPKPVGCKAYADVVELTDVRIVESSTRHSLLVRRERDDLLR